MRHTADNGKLSEVLVDRDKHATVGCGMRENLFVARIDRPISHPLDLVTTGGDHGLRVAPHAAVE
ncbi:MAG: hypothetical protein Q8K82_12975 [Gemmatimonadaceae bacterium]|nr:hypothetical protein [Gemmatimonadaceae bacterium]